MALPVDLVRLGWNHDHVGRPPDVCVDYVILAVLQNYRISPGACVDGILPVEQKVGVQSRFCAETGIHCTATWPTDLRRFFMWLVHCDRAEMSPYVRLPLLQCGIRSALHDACSRRKAGLPLLASGRRSRN